MTVISRILGILLLVVISNPVLSSNWNQGSKTSRILDDQQLTCNFTRYEASGYELSKAKSWIRPSQTHVFRGTIATYPDRKEWGSALITENNNSKLSWVYRLTSKDNKGQTATSRFKYTFFKTNGKVAASVDFVGFRGIKSVWGACSVEPIGENSLASVNHAPNSDELFVDDNGRSSKPVTAAKTANPPTFSCERQTQGHYLFSTQNHFDVAFPKKISLEIDDWKSREGSKVLSKVTDKLKLRLLPDGKLLADMAKNSHSWEFLQAAISASRPEMAYLGIKNIGYKCERNSLQLTAETSAPDNNLVDKEKITSAQVQTNTRQQKTEIASTNPQPHTTSSAELLAAQEIELELEQLGQQLAALKAQQEQRQQTIAADTQKPTITASASSNGADGVISGTVRDNVEVAEVMVNGQVAALNVDGSFKTQLYIPRSGKAVEIVAVDARGNKATETLFLERGAVQGATGPVFASLNPSGKRVKPNKDALALIIGVADYERTPAKAAYADKDAKTFYDYAMLKLGIPTGNIKELVNVDANRIDVSLAIKDWITRTTKQGSSDIYVFFAGHGLASQSGEQMYLLPYDGSPRLLEDSAISRENLFSDIASANPRSVTVFLDTCYSGTTRGTDMLIASRPIAIKALQQSVPDNFTVFTAAAGDQTAKPLEEAKHGMFSYFLMKGMEGEADSNQDNKITAGELHQYVQSNVVQQSSGSQTPELQGDAERVLVSFQ
jgi:hypothetical protein